MFVKIKMLKGTSHSEYTLIKLIIMVLKVQLRNHCIGYFNNFTT